MSPTALTSTRALPVFNGSNAPAVEPVPWIYEGVLARGAGTLLFGQPGVSKTVQTALLAAHLALGKSFGPFAFQGKICNVLYLDFDSSWEWNGELFQAAFRGLGVEGIPANFYYFSPQTKACRHDGEDDPPLLGLEELGSQIAQTVKELGIDVVICDSLGQMMLGDTNSGQEVALALRQGLNTARGAGAAVMVIDHATKAAVGSASVPTPMGSQQKRAWARMSIVVESEKGQGNGVTRWTVDKSNAKPFEPFLTRIVFTSFGERMDKVEMDFLGEAGPRGNESDRLDRKEEGLAGILNALQSGPLTRSRLKEASGVSGGTFDRALRDSQLSGEVVQLERGKYALASYSHLAPPHHSQEEGTVEGVPACVLAPESGEL